VSFAQQRSTLLATVVGAGGFAAGGLVLGAVMFGGDIDFQLKQNAEGKCVSTLKPDHRKSAKTGNTVYWDVKNKCEPNEPQPHHVEIRFNDPKDCGPGSYLDGYIKQEGHFYCSVAFVPPIGEDARRPYHVFVDGTQSDPELEIRGKGGRTFDDLVELLRSILSYLFD
jgi:hypothetical protein